MGSSSVTGVGNGAAGKSKNDNGRSQFVSLLDPHIVFHGSLQLDGGGSGTVTMPEDITGPASRFTILIAGKGWGVNKNIDEEGNLISFDIAGSNDQFLDFMVVDGVSSPFAEDYTP